MKTWLTWSIFTTMSGNAVMGEAGMLDLLAE
jgi:hypothetical protein